MIKYTLYGEEIECASPLEDGLLTPFPTQGFMVVMNRNKSNNSLKFHIISQIDPINNALITFTIPEQDKSVLFIDDCERIPYNIGSNGNLIHR